MKLEKFKGFTTNEVVQTRLDLSFFENIEPDYKPAQAGNPALGYEPITRVLPRGSHIPQYSVSGEWFSFYNGESIVEFREGETANEYLLAYARWYATNVPRY
jgi:hypothetical protein